MSQPTVEKVLKLAFSQVGYVEKPVNITKYGAEFGANPAQWCGLFLMWVFKKAGYHDFPNTAYTPNGVKEWKEAKKWKTKGEVKPGSIVYFDFPEDGINRVSHVGIAVRHMANNQVLCIEGNTASSIKGDQRNGGEVCLKLRHPNYIVGWAEPDYVGAYHPIVAEIVQAYTHGVKPFVDTDPIPVVPPKKAVKKAASK